MIAELLSGLSMRLGWTLLHSLWQFSGIAIGLVVVLAFMRKSSPAVRYIASCIALTAMVVSAVVTFSAMDVSPTPSSSLASTSIEQFSDSTEPDRTTDQVRVSARGERASPGGRSESAIAPPNSGTAPAEEPSDTTLPTEKYNSTASWHKRAAIALAASAEPWLGTLCWLWLLGTLILSLRPIFAFHCARRLRFAAKRELSAHLRELCHRVSRSVGLKRVVLVVESSLVDVPTMIGWLKPMVLLPASSLTGLTCEQLQAVVAHEMAHVRRHDYFVNTLQVLIETFFFYHPAVWWVSRRLRIMREECCDEIAVNLTGDRTGYARLLLWLDEHRQNRPLTACALSASGGLLLQRVRRIVRQETPSNSGAGSVLLVVMLTVLTGLGGFFMNAMGSEGIFDSQSIGKPRTELNNESPHTRSIATSWIQSEIRLPEKGDVFSILFSQDESSLQCIAYGKGEAHEGHYPRVRTWEIQSKTIVKEVPLEWQSDWARFVESFMLSEDARYVFGSLGDRLGVWDAHSGQLLRRLDPKWEGFGDLTLRNIAASQSADVVACSGITNRLGLLHDGYLYAWNVETGELIRSITSQHTGDIQSMALSRDGKRIAAWPAAGGVGIWQVASGEQVFEFANKNPPDSAPFPVNIEGALDQVLGMQFSHDGKTLAIGDLVGVKLLDTDTANVRRQLKAHFRYNSPSFVFSSNDHRLLRFGVRLDQTREVLMWDIHSGEQISAFKIDGAAAAFSNTGAWLAIGCDDDEGAIALWQLPDESKAGENDPARDRESAEPQEDDTNPRNNAEDTSKLPWRAFGRVTDQNAQPLADVTIRAATGMATLTGGGTTKTDKDGRYDFRFGMGVMFGDVADNEPHPQTQVAQITAHLDGHFEKNFSRHGNGMGSLLPIPNSDLKDWNLAEDQVVLPNRPREINFVMLPAAKVRGTLVDVNGVPLADYSVSLTADELPPGSSVLAQVRTDAQGRFAIRDIPTTTPYQFEVRKPRDQLRSPWNDTWASAPINFLDSDTADLTTTIRSEHAEIKKLVVKQLYLQIIGPGIHGKEAVEKARDVQPFPADSFTRLTAERMELERTTLELKNEVDRKESR